MGNSCTNTELASSDAMTSSPLGAALPFDQFGSLRAATPTRELSSRRFCSDTERSASASTFRSRRPSAVDTSYARTYSTVARERRRLSRRDCPLFWQEDGPAGDPNGQSASG